MIRVAVAAHPGARQERVALLADETLGVWVRQRPIAGQANAAVEAALASALGLRPRQVQIVVGQANRRKLVDLDVRDMSVVRERLLAYPVRSD
jgi:uncharacterized protein YggU (UPF0235/DUF167 family)